MMRLHFLSAVLFGGCAVLVEGAGCDVLPRRDLLPAFHQPSPRSAPSSAKVSTIYQFPNEPTWLENLAQRANGLVLATELTPSAKLLQFDPSQPSSQTPVVVASVPNKTSLLGIVEYLPDVFAVIAGNFTLGKTISSQKGSYEILSVNMNQSPATVKILATFPNAEFLNGMTFVPPVSSVAPLGILLAADSQLGAVWSLNIATGATALASKDPLMIPCDGTILGINGIRYAVGENKTYFSNSYCQGGFIASIAIDPVTGKSVGSASLVDNKRQNIAYVDDFALDFVTDQAYYAHGTYDQIGSVDLKTAAVGVVAGVVNTTEIAQPTSVIVGRTTKDKAVGRLYVTTAGGLAAPINGTIVVGAQLLAVDMGWSK